jgi:hypothetical protein
MLRLRRGVNWTAAQKPGQHKTQNNQYRHFDHLDFSDHNHPYKRAPVLPWRRPPELPVSRTRGKAACSMRPKTDAIVLWQHVRLVPNLHNNSQVNVARSNNHHGEAAHPPVNDIFNLHHHDNHDEDDDDNYDNHFQNNDYQRDNDDCD